MGLLSWIYGGSDLQAQGDALDARIAANAQADYGPGGRFYNAGNWEAVQQDLANSKTGDVNGQLNEAFVSGLNDGAANITGAVSGTFDLAARPLAAILAGIPWYVWLGVVAFIFWPTIARRLVKA